MSYAPQDAANRPPNKRDRCCFVSFFHCSCLLISCLDSNDCDCLSRYARRLDDADSWRLWCRMPLRLPGRSDGYRRGVCRVEGYGLEASVDCGRLSLRFAEARLSDRVSSATSGRAIRFVPWPSRLQYLRVRISPAAHALPHRPGMQAPTDLSE